MSRKSEEQVAVWLLVRCIELDGKKVKVMGQDS